MDHKVGTSSHSLRIILYYSIFRILLLPVSATYRFVPSVVIPVGLLKPADVPVGLSQFEEHAFPVPARVVTAVERLSAVPWMDPPISLLSVTELP